MVLLTNSEESTLDWDNLLEFIWNLFECFPRAPALALRFQQAPTQQRGFIYCEHRLLLGTQFRATSTKAGDVITSPAR